MNTNQSYFKFGYKVAGFFILSFSLAVALITTASLLISINWNIIWDTDQPFINTDLYRQISMTRAFDMLRSENSYIFYDDQNTSLLFYVTDLSTNEIIYQTADVETIDSAPEVSTIYRTTNSNDNDYMISENISYLPDGKAETALTYCYNSQSTVSDNIHFFEEIYRFIAKSPYQQIAVIIVSACISLLMLTYLCYVSGWEYQATQIHLNFFDKIPFDVIMVMEMLMGIFALDIFEAVYNDFLAVSILVIGVICVILMLLVDLLSFCTRTKADTWLKNNLSVMIILFCWKAFTAIMKWIFEMISAIPMMLKVVAMLILFLLGSLLAVWRTDVMLLYCFAATVIVFIYFYQLSQVKKATAAIYNGELYTRVSKKWMFPEIKKEMDMLESLQNGLEKAVNDKLKSEKLKTELITNISHDIKTPLTSIINYTDLLQKNPDEQQRNEYLAIVAKHSQRLKKLIQDLIDASKASSGNIEVNLQPTSVKAILEQSIGEYEEKLQQSSLTPIVNEFSNDLMVIADGRQLWRVFDNLLGNACKYALPNTRLYIDVEDQKKQVTITFKNISSQSLNISSDELMERFVRGERSRHTEGSGLGLNIAESLVKLQNGTLNLFIDGDLFKAVVTLSKAN